ncbi:Multidrug and toxin extrusion protein 1 [Hondaea fermentalgiana]|uniref:Multidrug and toxin extrusion protein 1 n=1 Tax=Hondaea fermentalgiana TaxID=2315210 RepID=A0A2R5GVI1_9STRA|nr:Multidrug and toxin extrusion protein 1 [Hondaea fermentalgiana]|eukprot:GBG34862.1 Multidrug and toxin extrusion protein 1 [Hondaea fermentalgiana]
MAQVGVQDDDRLDRGLLAGHADDAVNGIETNADGEDNGVASRPEDVEFWHEMKELSVLSLPVALSTLCRLVIINTDTAFLGHLGKKELTAASFGNTWNQFLSNIVFAPGYALNSLGSQAIGAGNPKLAGVWLQLAIFITTIMCIPVLAGYLLTKPVVALMVNSDGVPELAQEFNNVSMLVLWPMVMYMIIRQYFQSMQIVTPAMVVSGLTVGVNYAMNYVFVPPDGLFRWGIKGSPFATFLSMLFQIGCFTTYTVVIRGYHKPYWGGWSWDFLAKSRVARFSKMVLPMAVGIVLENSGLQMISFSTGRIGTEENRESLIAGNAILASLWGVLWSLYWGCGLALQVRVGAYLGQGNVYGAKLVARISIVLVVIICFLVGLFTFLFRVQIAKLFSTEQEVIDVVDGAMYALVIDYFTACMALCAVNLLEAMAQNRILAFTLSAGMWCVQVPCALLFAYKIPYFKDHPVRGIWMGQVCGEVFKLVILWTYIARLDWDQMCREAKERSEANETTDEADEQLEHLLEEEDPAFEEESQAIPIARSHHLDTAEAIASSMQAGSPSPFIGSRSPKFVRQM